jgi:hypothetical protein
MYLCVLDRFSSEALSIQGFRLSKCLYAANSGKGAVAIPGRADLRTILFNRCRCEGKIRLHALLLIRWWAESRPYGASA